MQNLTTNTLIVGPDPERCLQTKVPGYALLFFDHLHSEYLALKSAIALDPNLIQLLESITDKRLRRELTWADVYAFDMALLDVRPLENLIRKAYDARAKYRTIAGQKEYDEYLASKPPDLAGILIRPDGTISHAPPATSPPTSPPVFSPPVILSPPPPPPEPDLPQSVEMVKRLLRADIGYLLNKFYLYYAMLPLRECFRDQLTTQALRVTIFSLLVFGIVLALSVGVGGQLLPKLWPGERITAALGLTIAAVVFFGILGGCVSMLQRIQSAPSEGDALFNLASITNGWRGLSLSPLYGGIFATLLFIMFAAGILQGAIFPKIETAAGSKVVVDVTKPAAAAATPAPQESPAAQGEATPAESPAATETPTAAPTTTPTPSDTQTTGVLQLKDFFTQTGPTDGVSFALLMIWSFIAGFAERLVPDTLNRFVAKSQAVQGTNA